MGSASLASEIGQLAEQLVGAAEGAGLAELRPRSSPKRRRWESSQFLTVFAASLDSRARRLEPGARRILRTGSLAACQLHEVEPFFALWTQVLRQHLARTAREAERASLALLQLKKSVLAELEGWAADRVDVIALGASAGGIAPLVQILDQLTAEVPATLLVVLHVSDDSPGVLPKVLGRNARLPMENAVEGGKLWLGNVYVAPPGRHLTVAGDALRLIDTPRERYSRPSIDVLFRSAAEARGSDLMSVLLSGSGSDGASGTEAVRAAGGVTLAQLPSSAEFPSMPEEAIARGVVQRAATPAVLGRLVARVASRGRRVNRLP